jgi:hypothetical protein
MRKSAQKENSFPQNAEACPEEKRLSAKCGNLFQISVFRTVRFLAWRKNDKPHHAVFSLTKKQQTAKCGNLALF